MQSLIIHLVLSFFFLAAPLYAAPETDTSFESCQRACTRDHDVCLDGADPHYDNYGDSGFGSSRSRFGAGADCDKALKPCLAACRGR